MYAVSIPSIVAEAMILLNNIVIWSLRKGYSVIISLAAFTAVTIGYYPFMIPASIELTSAASSSKTLIFMLSGIGFFIPVMLIYSGYQYLVFRGKVKMDAHTEISIE